MRYLFIIQKAPRNYAGYFPDVPGYAATARTVEKILDLAKEGIAFHLEDEVKVPKARSLTWHLDKGDLELQPTDLVTWVEYQHKPQLAAA